MARAMLEHDPTGLFIRLPQEDDFMTKTSRADFEALVRRAGLTISQDQVDDIYAGWGFIEPMLERLRVHGRDRTAEPALTFDPTSFGTEAA